MYAGPTLALLRRAGSAIRRIRAEHRDSISVRARPFPVLDDDVHIWCVELKHDRDLVFRARSILAENERTRADEFRFSELQDDFVVSRASLRVLLSVLGFGPPGEVRFRYGLQGKPALDEEVPGSLGFNVLHSQGLMACALVRGLEIGIDIEFHRSIPDLEGIARRFFSPEEHAELVSVVGSQRMAAFYSCWVRKEAFLKALGTGFSGSLDSFRVSVGPGRSAALLHIRDAPGEHLAWAIHELSPAPGFSGAVALRDRRKRIQVHRADVRELFVSAGVLSLVPWICGFCG